MIDDLTPYPAMKDPGVPWLGEVPEHWGVLPNRAIFDEVKERDRPGADMLSVTITKGVIRQRALLEGSSKKDSSKLDRSAYKFVRPGDIAYNKMRAWQGALGVSEYAGIVSPAYVVQRPREGTAARYVHYLLRTPAFAKEAERWSYGITSDMWSLRPEHFKMIYSCLPPLPEQHAIVKFLDRADRKIRRYIRAKQKLIKLLEEQKQAIIHHAVTRGLDPNVRFKPSGVEWVGEVPEHWELVPNRALLSQRKILVGDQHNKYQLLSLTKGGVIVRDVASGRGKFSADLGTSQEVRTGDLVFCLFDVPETPRTVGLSAHDGMITGAYTVFECSDTVLARFLEAFYIAMDDRKLLSPVYSGLRNTIPPSTFLGIKTPLPPRGEQASIVDRIGRDTSSNRAIVERTRGEIQLLGEYRTRLFADVVTGKLDVREAAAALPDLEEPNTVDEEFDPDSELELPEDDDPELDSVEDDE